MLPYAITAMIAYLLSLTCVIPGQLRESLLYRRVAILFAVIALVCHAVALQLRIFDIANGQNLSLLNIASSVSLIICAVMTFVATRDRGWFLLPVIYSFAIINLALVTFIPGEFVTHLESRPTLLVHIGLALFSYATLIIAALYATQLAWIDFQLKHKKFRFSPTMPPLMSIERKMFHITQVGVVLLTLTLISGFLFLDNLLAPENVHKMIFSTLAWLVYLVLLWGHYRRGWRGRSVVWFSFSGAFVLTLAYFGSRFTL